MCTEDYCDKFAQLMRSMAQQREVHGNNTSIVQPVIRNTQVVMDLVASLSYSQWTLPSRAPNQGESIEQVALRNMALVHRSWTGIAR